MKYTLLFLALLLQLFSHKVNAQPCNSSTTYLSQTICEGSPYYFFGTALSTAGTYNDTITLSGGCDSIISLQLFVIPTIYTHVSHQVCGSIPYNFYGRYLTQPGTYYDTLFAPGTFCDSIIVLTLTSGGPNPTRTIYDTLCHGILNYYGQVFSYSSNVTYILPDTNGGCDSIIHIHIYDREKYSITQYYNCCAGQVVVFNGKRYSAPGYYMDTVLSAANGCDSAVYLYLQLPHQYKALNLCPGGSVTYHGKIYTQRGYYLDTIFAPLGCDTLLGISIYQNYPSSYKALYSCSDSVIFDGRTYAVPGNFIDTVNTAACDSLIYLTIIHGAPQGHDEYGGCPGQLINHHGHLDTIPPYGIGLLDTVTSVFGCDSIVYSYLYIAQPSSQININACAGQTYSYNGHSYRVPGVYTDTLTSVLGCDSMVYLYLSTNIFTEVHLSGCAGQTMAYNGHTFTVPYNFYDTLTAVGGCDSIVWVIANVLSGGIVATGNCGQSYIYNGHTYTFPGGYVDTIASVSGCDSLIYISLESFPTTPIYGDTLYLSTCQSQLVYYLNNTPYSFSYSGPYYLTGNSCDTIHLAYVSLNLPGYSENIYKNVCSGSLFSLRGRDEYIPADSLYWGTIITDVIRVTTPGQCDSVFHLFLKVQPQPAAVFVADSFCQGSTYHYLGRSYTQEGLDTFMLPSAYCDTMLILSLTYTDLPTPRIFRADSLLFTNITSGVSYQWYMNGQPIPGADTTYYIATQGAVYSLSITSLRDTSCSHMSAPYVNTGIESATEPTFALYPNPNSGTFTIETDAYQNAEVSICDIFGRQLYTHSLNSSVESLSLPLTVGTYIVWLRQGQQNSYRKLIVTH